ncbi:hypothetical protein [Bradyrhizobium sp. LB11.1]|uniref:hypothetical protein n=1 Tax=Bradyrhizobium sp. LB11.1 TaxID=3156326 RepID=UPI00339846FF
MVDGESLLELDALVIIDNDGGFRDVIAQPFQLTLDVAGRIRRWTPDFLIVKDGRDLLVEVKCLSWLYHRDPAKAALARSRVNAIESACARRDCDFMLLTEDEIRVEPRLYNASICHRHNAPHLVPRELIVVGLSALAAAPDELTIEQFAQLIPPVHPIHALGLAVRLERLGHLRIDRRTRYSLSSTMVKTFASPNGARA